MRKFLRIVGILLVIMVLLAILPGIQESYTIKKRAEAAVNSADIVKEQVNRFYAEQKRFPAVHEALKFRADGNAFVKSIDYDAEKKMVVVTIHLRDQRFAMYAEEKGGAISWTCRTIDFPVGDLPPACR